jgi:hypothetical protein
VVIFFFKQGRSSHGARAAVFQLAEVIKLQGKGDAPLQGNSLWANQDVVVFNSVIFSSVGK